MKLSIQKVIDAGDLKKERITIKALSALDIGEFMLFDTTYIDENTVSNKVRHSFWFPDREINDKDLIIVYTKKGVDTQKTNSNGSISHFFYMGLDATIWNKDGDTAVILQISDWISKKMISS